MRHTIDFNGEQLPVDYSIMTALDLAEAYDTTVTELQTVVVNFNQRKQFDFLIKLGVIALNDGARRDGLDRRYGEYEVRDLFTKDMSLAGRMLQGFFATLHGEEVFPEPSQPTAKRSAKSRG